MSVMITSYPASAQPGSTIQIQGASSCGPASTSFSASANGIDVAVSTVDWSTAENWTAKVIVPPCDPEGVNVLVFRVACDPDKDSADIEISPCP